MWGVNQAIEMIKPLFDALYIMQKEILKLMMEHIDENLGSSNCTEI